MASWRRKLGGNVVDRLQRTFLALAYVGDNKMPKEMMAERWDSGRRQKDGGQKDAIGESQLSGHLAA
jgi:hypothetical protein